MAENEYGDISTNSGTKSYSTRKIRAYSNLAYNNSDKFKLTTIGITLFDFIVDILINFKV